MSNCPFEQGDRVDWNDICGTVVKKSPLGDGWIIEIRLASGQSITPNCSEVTACTH
jgi:hypothetical protein